MTEKPTQTPFAANPAESRGRLISEPESKTRTAFQRDRDRIIHSGAFRRLKYKTQVFVYHEGDYYRTRLTHSLEVAQIARSVSRFLGLNEDLAEALALAHDLGHTPFGHAGEDALNEAMAPFGGFSHNEQTFRVMTLLENRYADFDGLNLSWETLEGTAKHNGPVLSPVPATMTVFNQQMDLQLSGYAGLEAQVAALSDDIAYMNHDIDDGVRAGLFGLDDLKDIDLARAALTEVDQRYPKLDAGRRKHELLRRLIDLMVSDLIKETQARLAALNPGSADDIRAAGKATAAFSSSFWGEVKPLRQFLFARMYRHYTVNRMIMKAKRVVGELFSYYMGAPQSLPGEWRAKVEGLKDLDQARIIADYIAGMTDRYALGEHHKLFDLYTKR